MRSPLGIVSKRWSSNTLLSASTDLGSMSPSQMIQLCVSAGSLITLRALAVSIPSNHSLVSWSMCSQQTDPGHGFWVHDVDDVLLVLPLVGIFEHFLECGLLATRGPNRGCACGPAATDLRETRWVLANGFPLVVLLHRKQLPRQQAQRHNALSHDLCSLETLASIESGTPA